MKILLIYPGWTNNYYSLLNPARIFSNKYSIFPPLNLAYLASVAESLGHDVRIHDGEINKTTLYDYYNIISDYEPDIIGLTAYTPSFELSKNIARLVKNNFKNIITVIGGVHYSAMNDDDTFLPDEFDYGFINKSLQSFKEFLIYHKPITGMVHRTTNGLIKINGHNDDALISKIMPSRHLLENNKYKRPTKYGIRNFTTIFMSIGCPFKCIFCSNKNQSIIYRDVDTVLEEIKEIKEKYNIDHFVFLDDTLTINRERMLSFCDKLLSQKIYITFEGSTRANLVDDELMNKMSLAGMVGIGFGLETADDNMREYIKKNVDLDSYIKANEYANKYGISTQNSCIIGLPNESIKSIRKTLLFLRENKSISQANISIATPYPGTELYKKAKNNEDGLKLLTEDFTKYKRYGSAVMDVGNLKANDLIKIQEECFASIYFPRFRWKYTIQRSGLKGLTFDLLKITKLLITGRTRFLFTKNLRKEND